MQTRAQKISSRRPGNMYLITQSGDEIDCYSILLLVPAHKETAFQTALNHKPFPAEDYGTIIHYSAGELTPDDALLITQTTS